MRTPRKPKARKNAKPRLERVTIWEMEKLEKHSLSFGLGVQSTAMVLKVINGELPRPNLIIFADPMWEDQGSYENLERIKPMIQDSGIPFHIVSAGNIREDGIKKHRLEVPFFVNASRYETIEGKMKLLISDTTKAWRKEHKKAEVNTELFLEPELNLEDTIHKACTEFGKKVEIGLIKSGWKEMKTSQIGRQCTEKYKIRSVMKLLREQYGASAKTPIGQWLGITTDEWHRMKISRIKASVLMYPLIDLGMSRTDCEEYCEDHDFPIPVKSACLMCPFHSNVLWKTYNDEQINDVADWEEENIQMIASDPKLRHLPYFTNGVRVHNSMQPIDERPFDSTTQEDKGSPCMGNAGCFL